MTLLSQDIVKKTSTNQPQPLKARWKGLGYTSSSSHWICSSMYSDHDWPAVSQRSWQIHLPGQLHYTRGHVQSRCCFAALRWLQPIWGATYLNLAVKSSTQAQRCATAILKVLYREWIMNKEILRQAGICPLASIVAEHQFWFVGHILCLPLQQPAKIAMNWFPPVGKRKQGWPKITWCQTFIEDMKSFDVSWYEAEIIAADHRCWGRIYPMHRTA